MVFLAYYGVYTAYLILTATQHAALDEFSTAMFFFVIPLTLLTLGVSVAREMRRRRMMRVA